MLRIQSDELDRHAVGRILPGHFAEQLEGFGVIRNIEPDFKDLTFRWSIAPFQQNPSFS